MSVDPYYEKIIEKLNGDLDPDVFEACVTDILRKIYPALVPIKGGGDSGMDGAVADFEGEPFPLIVTTGENVIGNLSKNLRSYLKHGGKRRKAILATSRYLTPRRTQNLFKKATEFGFTLVQVHLQPSIADLLYYSPHWCTTLLGLDSKPSALSQLPKTNRPEVNESLIAREADFKWLVNTPGDKLLYGHPGSGKTFLLKAFVKAGNGLFVINEDMGEVIAACRSQQPSCIIIDDAQLSIDLIKNLIHFRKETRASFSIVASCWNIEADLLAAELSLPTEKIRRLELLSRDEIVEVIKDAGLIGPERLIKEIVDQAEGKPGLAATFTHLCLLGDVRSVFLGEAINKSVRRFFEPQLGKRAISVLAAFSIGGENGFPMQTVSNLLGIALLEIQTIVVQLAAGGIIFDTHYQTLAVFPEALRYNLIKDVFFRGASSLPITPFLEQAPNYMEAVQAIVGAYTRGASVQWSFLINLLESANSPTVWHQFAWSGEDETVWIMENHPDQLLNVAYAGLNFAPRKAISMLLELPENENSGGITGEESVSRIVERWIKGGWPGDDETISNRLTLVDAACEWLVKGKDMSTGLRAVKIALDPVCEEVTTDPGSGLRVTIRSAFLSTEEMIKLQNQWQRVKEVLEGKEINDWKPLKDLFHKWAFHEHANIHLPDTVRDLMKSFAKVILENVVELARNQQGVLHWVKQMAHYTNFEIKVTLDKEFEALFPIEDRKSYKETEKTHAILIDQLSSEWSKRPAEEVAKKLFWMEYEATKNDIRWPKWSIVICYKIAAIISNPYNWAETFISEKLPVDMILPFVEKSAQMEEQGWLELIKRCLDNTELRVIAISIYLTCENTPNGVLENAFDLLAGFDGLIETLCIRGQVPILIQKKLLNHSNLSIRVSTAKGVWHVYDQGKIPVLLKDDWINAILESKEDYIISSVLALYPEFAFRWLASVVRGNATELDDFIRSMQTAVIALSDKEKVSLLELMSNDWQFAKVVTLLIGNNIEIYRSLLSLERLKRFHLAPLIWDDSESWIDKARTALESGYIPQEIVEAAHGFYNVQFGVVTWSGPESQYRQEWIDRFGKLCSHPDSKIREIGAIGQKRAQEDFQKAIKRERSEEIYGYRGHRRI